MKESDVDISSFPIVKKSDIVDNQSTLIPLSMLIHSKPIIHTRTSGSTGIHMDIYWTKSDYFYSMMPLWYKRYKWYGILPSDRFCTFYSFSEYGTNIPYEYEKSSLRISKSLFINNDIEKVVELINAFHPILMIIQPFIAQELVCYIESNNIIFTNSIKFNAFNLLSLCLI